MATDTQYDLALGLDTSQGRRKTKAWEKDLLSLGRTTDKVQDKMTRLSRTGGVPGARKTDQLSTSTRKLGESAGFTSPKVDKLATSSRRMGKEQSIAAGSTSKLMGVVRKIVGPLAIAAAGFLSVAAGVNELRAGVGAAVEIESISRSLNVAAGSALAGADAMTFVRQEADRLGTSLAPTARGFAQMSAASIGTTLAGEGVRDIFSAVTEATSLLGLTAADTEGALRAINQIMSKGTVQAEELRGQLGERIPGAFQIMARGLDVTTPKLNKMLEQGQVLATVALPAFARELRKTFGTDVTTRFNTAAAGLARFQTAVFDARVVLGQAFLPALGDVTKQIAVMLVENEAAIASFGRLAGEGLRLVVLLFSTAADNANLLTAALGAFVAVKSITFLVTLGTSLVAAIGEMIAYTAATTAATASQVALAGAVGLTIPIFNAQGKVVSTVTQQTVIWGGATHAVAGAQTTAAVSTSKFLSVGLTPLTVALAAVVGGLLLANSAITDWADRMVAETSRVITASDNVTRALAGIGSETRKVIGGGDLQAMSELLGRQTTSLEELTTVRDQAQQELQKLSSQVDENVGTSVELTEAITASELAYNNANREVRTLEKSVGEIIGAMREWTGDIEKVSKVSDKAQKALDRMTQQIKEVRIAGEIMREFRVGAEAAGAAASIVLASGMEIARDRALELVQALKSANAELEAIASRQLGDFFAANAPQQLASRDFDPFASLDPSAALGAVFGAPGTGFMKEIADLELAAARKRRAEREKEFKRGQASVKEADEALASVQADARENMARGFDAIVGTLGLFDNDLANIVGHILNIVEAARGGGAGGAVGTGGGLASSLSDGGLLGGVAGGGGFLAGVTAVAPFLSAAVGIFDSIKSFFDRRDERKFGLPIEAGITGGEFRGQAIGTGSITDIQAVRAVQGMRDAIDDFRISAGLIVTDLPKIGISMRNDGEEFELSVAGVVQGVFDSFEEAFSVGLRTAIGQADLSNIGPVLQQALSSASFGKTTEELLEMIPVLREIDDVNAGLTASYSAAKLAADQYLTALDVESEKLLGLGVSIEDVIAFREREIQAQQRLLEASGAALAGVSSNISAFQAFADAAAAFNDAQETELVRQEALARRADTTLLSPGGFPLAPPGTFDDTGGKPGRDGAGGSALTRETAQAGAAFAAAGVDMAAAGDNAEGASSKTKAWGGLVEHSGEQAEAAGEKISDAFVDMIRDAVAIQGELGFLQEIQRFQDAFGFSLIGNEELRKQIAALEFRSAQIRIVLLVRELALNAEILGITDAVIAKWQGFASEIASLDFADATLGGGGGGGGGRGGRRQARQAAAAEFRNLVTGINDELSDANPILAEYADRQDKLTEASKKGKIGAEELAAGLASLAELQLRDVVQGFAAGPAPGPLGAFQEIAERQQQALDAAMVIAAGDPGAFEAAAAAITAGVDAELAELGVGVLDSFGSPFRDLRNVGGEALRNIAFLTNHLEELGLTAREVANVVAQSLFLEVVNLAEDAARDLPSGTDDEALARAVKLDELATLRANFERELLLLRLEIIEKELIASGAMNAGFQQMIDNGREFLNTTILITDAQDNLRNAVEETAALFFRPTGIGLPAAGGAAAPEAAGRLLSDLIHEQLERAMTELESAQDDFQHTLEEIAERSGTAAERIFSIALAEEELARTREDILDRQLADVRALLAEIEGADTRISAQDRFLQAQAEFRELGARAQAGDAAALADLAAAGVEFRDQISGFFGAGGASLSALDELTAILRSVSSQGVGLSLTGQGTVGGAGGSFDTATSVQGPVGAPVVVPPLSAGPDDVLARQAMLALVELARRFEQERATDRTVRGNVDEAQLSQGEEQISLAVLGNAVLEAVRQELENRQDPAGGSS